MTKPHDIIKTQLPEFNDLPPISLYMDQLLEVLDKYLSPLKREEDQPTFTKTMVNNYVKAGVVTPPIKKKYTHNSVIELIMIYYLKQVLSISDTNDIIKNMHQTSLIESYAHFKQVVENIGASLETTFNASHSFDTALDPVENQKNIKDAIISLSIESAIKKQVAESLIDQQKKATTTDPAL